MKHGSALECAAILDILCRCRVIAETDWQAGKELLARIVAMLTRMRGSAEHVREPETAYGYEYEYGYGAQHGPNKPLQPTLGAGVKLVASFLISATVVACTTAPSTPSRKSDGRDCADWGALSQKDRVVVIGSALEQKVGRPTDSKLAACLWSIVDQIAEHSSEICTQRGGSYGDAASLAFRTAIEYCEKNLSDAPNKPL